MKSNRFSFEEKAMLLVGLVAAVALYFNVERLIYGSEQNYIRLVIKNSFFGEVVNFVRSNQGGQYDTLFVKGDKDDQDYVFKIKRNCFSHPSFKGRRHLFAREAISPQFRNLKIGQKIIIPSFDSCRSGEIISPLFIYFKDEKIPHFN